MSKYLSTSEVAKLLNTSTYNIRYYEKEGLIPSPLRTEKGYRLFSFDDINMLCTVMMLRNCDISIKDINELMKDYKPEKYLAYVKESSDKLEDEIKRLQSLKKSVDSILDDSKWSDLGFFKRKYPDRYTIELLTSEYEHPISEREFYESIVASDVQITSLYKSDIICRVREKNMTYYITHEQGKGKIPAGTYLCYRFKGDIVEKFEEEVEKFLQYISDNRLKTSEALYLTELNLESYYYEAYNVHEFQIRLK